MPQVHELQSSSNLKELAKAKEADPLAWNFFLSVVARLSPGFIRRKIQLGSFLLNESCLQEVIKQLHAENGVLRLGKKQLITSDLKLIQSLNADNNDRHSQHQVGRGGAVRALGEITGPGPISEETDQAKWALQHEVMKRSFSKTAVYQQALPSSLPRFHDFVELLSIQAAAVNDGEELKIQMLDKLMAQTFNTVTAYLFPEFPAEEHPEEYRQIMEAFTSGVKVSAIPKLLFNVNAPAGLIAGSKEKLQNLTLQFLEEAASQARENGSESLLAKLAAFLDKKAPEYSPADFIGSVTQLLSAGQETTASTVGFGLQALAAHPEWQDRLRTELAKQKITFSGVGFSWEKLAEYLQDDDSDLAHFINEVLRFNPPTFFLPMDIKGQEGSFEVGTSGERIHLTRGTEISIILQALHESPLYWTEPKTFNPDRFTKTDPAYREEQTQAYRPFNNFSIRVCAGKNLAEMQTRLLTALIVSNLDVTSYTGKVSMITGTRTPDKKSTVGFKLRK